MSRERSPAVKLFLTALIGALLLVPLLMIYPLVNDRQNQSRMAQGAITASWGGEQVIAGPVLVIPYRDEAVETETVNGQNRTRTVQVRREMFVSPLKQSITTAIEPSVKNYSIYRSVIYQTDARGTARFALPADLGRSGVTREQLLLGEAELRFGVSDPAGLTDGTRVTVDGKAQELTPGNGPAATRGSGFSTGLDWDGAGEVAVGWQYGLRGSRSIAVIPRGGETEWTITSSWQHPSFVGNFLPDTSKIGADGFSARYEGITNLALGESLVNLEDLTPPVIETHRGSDESYSDREYVPAEAAAEGAEQAKAAAVRLIEPVDLYSQVDRSVKYGFLFIGFTFMAFFMFDVIAGARVASAEYLLTGVGLILFFVLLLAFAEVIGFGRAYLVASAAVIGLLTAYSAAVLGGWRRAVMIGGMLTGLYATLYVLLNLEAWSLMIGSVLLFVALAAVMFTTRNINWSNLNDANEDQEAALA